MPGYDKSRFVDTSEEDLDEFACGICQDVFNNPMFSPCCRQTYCNDCINQWLTQNNTCPNDRKGLTPKELSCPPRVLINLLNKLRIKCDFHVNGCDEVMPLNDLDQHKEGCDFNPCRKCKNCGLNGGIQGHDCVQNLRVINQSISNEINRLTKENKDLKTKMDTLHRAHSPNPITNRSDSTLKIVNSRMEPNMQTFALHTAHKAHDQYKYEPEGKMSTFIRNEFEKKYKSLWNCLVSSSMNWGTSIHHYENHYIYFKIGLFHFMIWESSK